MPLYAYIHMNMCPHHTERQIHTEMSKEESHLLILLKDFLTYFCIEIPPFTHLKFLRHVESNGSFFLFTSLLATKFLLHVKQ